MNQIYLQLDADDMRGIDEWRQHKRQPIMSIIRDAVIAASEHLNGKPGDLDTGKVVRSLTLKVSKGFAWVGFLESLERIRKKHDLSRQQAVRYALRKGKR